MKLAPLVLLISLLTVTSASAGPSEVTFKEQAASAGLSHVFGGNADFVVGGGAVAFDCDNDGDADLFLAGGAASAQLFINRTNKTGQIRFAAIRPLTGSGLKVLKNVAGVYAFDFDNDADLDLFLLRFGGNALLENNGDCRFTVAETGGAIAKSGTWSTAFAAAWAPGATFPTLIVGNYVDRSRPLEKTGNCEPNALLRPGNTGKPAPGYNTAIPLLPGHCALSMLFVDWRNTGEADLRIANDREYQDADGGEQLWSIFGGTPRLYSTADGWQDSKIWGMGLAARDIDQDGFPEIAVTNMAENKLYTLKARDVPAPSFDEVAWARGAASQRPHTGGDPRPSTSWHNAFADFNNDGLDDLLIVKGNVDAMKQFAAYDPDTILLGIGQGRFAEASGETGIALNTAGRGGAVADFDRDGCLDIVVVNRNQPASLFRNESCKENGSNRISLRVRQPAPNTQAIGATVTLRSGGRSQKRFLAIGGGHAGGAVGHLHFGLGPEASGEIQVRWHDGATSGWTRLAAGSSYTLTRKEGRDAEFDIVPDGNP